MDTCNIAPEATAFDRATAVDQIQPGCYRAEIDPAWWVDIGPNGGYLSTIVMRAALAEVTANTTVPARASAMTMHYLSPPTVGPASIRVTVLRRGHRLTTLSGELISRDRRCVTGLVAVTHESRLQVDADLALRPQPPTAPPPRQLPQTPLYADGGPPYLANFEVIAASGPCFPVASLDPPHVPAVSEGWIRLRERRAIDDLALATIVDAWSPAIYTRIRGPVAVPTVTLTTYWRDVPKSQAHSCWMSVRSRLITRGFIEEDSEVWSPRGELLAQARQLALICESPTGSADAC